MPILLADRFTGTSPLDWEDADANRRERVLTLLSVEGEVAAAWVGLAAGDDVVFIGDDD